jgi:hypothetical protein
VDLDYAPRPRKIRASASDRENPKSSVVIPRPRVPAMMTGRRPMTSKERKTVGLRDEDLSYH